MKTYFDVDHKLFHALISARSCSDAHLRTRLMRKYTLMCVPAVTQTDTHSWCIQFANTINPAALTLSVEMFGFSFPLMLLLICSCVFQDLSIHHTQKCLSFLKLFLLHPLTHCTKGLTNWFTHYFEKIIFVMQKVEAIIWFIFKERQFLLWYAYLSTLGFENKWHFPPLST